MAPDYDPQALDATRSALAHARPRRGPVRPDVPAAWRTSTPSGALLSTAGGSGRLPEREAFSTSRSVSQNHPSGQHRLTVGRDAGRPRTFLTRASATPAGGFRPKQTRTSVSVEDSVTGPAQRTWHASFLRRLHFSDDDAPTPSGPSRRLESYVVHLYQTTARRSSPASSTFQSPTETPLTGAWPFRLAHRVPLPDHRRRRRIDKCRGRGRRFSTSTWFGRGSASGSGPLAVRPRSRRRPFSQLRPRRRVGQKGRSPGASIDEAQPRSPRRGRLEPTGHVDQAAVWRTRRGGASWSTTQAFKPVQVGSRRRPMVEVVDPRCPVRPQRRNAPRSRSSTRRESGPARPAAFDHADRRRRPPHPLTSPCARELRGHGVASTAPADPRAVNGQKDVDAVTSRQAPDPTKAGGRDARRQARPRTARPSGSLVEGASSACGTTCSTSARDVDRAQSRAEGSRPSRTTSAASRAFAANASVPSTSRSSPTARIEAGAPPA